MSMLLLARIRRVMASRVRSRCGFTLVEIMIAMLIFGAVVMGLAQAIPQGMSTREKARRLSVATFLAKDQMERLRSVAFSDADLAAGLHTDPNNPVEPGFRREWTVIDNNPIPGMKRVTVRVSFQSTSPDSQVVLVTQLTR
jgi:prepilin-type N-terminal cleavage/methylation domain-containing protein